VEPGRGGLNALQPSPRTLVFEGPVQCVAQPRAGDWRLRGRLRSEAAAAPAAPAAPAELLLSGVRASGAAQALPPRLHELRVHAQAPHVPAGYGLHLEALEGSYDLELEALRLHHDASQGFYQALPRTALPRLTRAGWAALLMLLRVPLVARLLK
jgi:hypothetical protein